MESRSLAVHCYGFREEAAMPWVAGKVGKTHLCRSKPGGASIFWVLGAEADTIYLGDSSIK